LECGDSRRFSFFLFESSIDDYLAFCKQRGEEPNKPFSGQFVNPSGVKHFWQEPLFAIHKRNLYDTVCSEDSPEQP
jgi:HicB family